MTPPAKPEPDPERLAAWKRYVLDPVNAKELTAPILQTTANS
jgi:hypothetical protein